MNRAEDDNTCGLGYIGMAVLGFFLAALLSAAILFGICELVEHGSLAEAWECFG